MEEDDAFNNAQRAIKGIFYNFLQFQLQLQVCQLLETLRKNDPINVLY